MFIPGQKIPCSSPHEIRKWRQNHLLQCAHSAIMCGHELRLNVIPIVVLFIASGTFSQLVAQNTSVDRTLLIELLDV
jgi:hypothetical protein